MGFLGDMSKYAIGALGSVTGGVVKVVGEVTQSEFLSEVGEGVIVASKHTGAVVGEAVDGAADVVAGLANENREQRDRGFKQMGRSVETMGRQVGAAASSVFESGGEVYHGLNTDDPERAKRGARELAKLVAVATVAVGVVDIIDGAEVAEAPAVDSGSQWMASGDGPVDAHPVSAPSAPITDPGLHTVEPHPVSGYVTADGVTVSDYWRDGDGDLGVDLTRDEGGGYLQTDPDGDPRNNLG